MNNLFYSVWGYRPVTEPDRPLNSLMDNIMDDAINNTNDYRFNPIMSLKNEYRKTYANYIQFNGFAESLHNTMIYSYNSNVPGRKA